MTGKKKAGRSKDSSSDRARGQGATYRVLAYQPLSVNIDPQGLGAFLIRETPCRIAIRAVHDEKSLQLGAGGSTLAIEFESDPKDDLIGAARRGLELLEDFLSAIAVVAGANFTPSELVQVARKGGEKADHCEFLIFKKLPLKHWSESITGQQIAIVRHMLAHWDGLEVGHRLRRAAQQYREAIGNLDDCSAFQEAYIGLETMEPPLAKMVGLTPGTEEVKGTCDACGAEFTRKRTTLVGVRAFVLNSLDPNGAEAGRKADWKLINGLRQDLMHGLEDPRKLGNRAINGLLACMHHLHAAICAASHATKMISERFRLARGGPMYVLAGTYTAATWPVIEGWGLVVEIKEFAWVPHDKYGFVPELSFKNNGLTDLQMGVAALTEPLSFATMQSIRPTPLERD